MLHNGKMDDIADLMGTLPIDEQVRSLIRNISDRTRIDSDDDVYYAYFITCIHVMQPTISQQPEILQYLYTMITEDGIDWSTIVTYGTMLPFSKRILEAVLRGGKTLSRTIQGATEPSTLFYVTIQPGYMPRTSLPHEIDSLPIIDVPVPNTRLKTVEPVRTAFQVLKIDVRRHVCVLQSHYSRIYFDVFARGPTVCVDGININLSQLCVWVWMRRFAIHEYITCIHTELVRQTKPDKPVKRYKSVRV